MRKIRVSGESKKEEVRTRQIKSSGKPSRQKRSVTIREQGSQSLYRIAVRNLSKKASQSVKLSSFMVDPSFRSRLRVDQDINKSVKPNVTEIKKPIKAVQYSRYTKEPTMPQSHEFGKFFLPLATGTMRHSITGLVYINNLAANANDGIASLVHTMRTRRPTIHYTASSGASELVKAKSFLGRVAVPLSAVMLVLTLNVFAESRTDAPSGEIKVSNLPKDALFEPDRNVLKDKQNGGENRKNNQTESAMTESQKEPQASVTSPTPRVENGTSDTINTESEPEQTQNIVKETVKDPVQAATEPLTAVVSSTASPKPATETEQPTNTQSDETETKSDEPNATNDGTDQYTNPDDTTYIDDFLYVDEPLR